MCLPHDWRLDRLLQLSTPALGIEFHKVERGIRTSSLKELDSDGSLHASKVRVAIYR